MKVLSIDWDYFQKVSVDTMRNCYPDGLDASTFLSEITWGSRYASDGKEINDVTVMEDELENMFKLLLEQDRDCPVMIANSHRNCYDFILSNLHEEDTEGVKLTNVDMHHDLMNENPDVDCGNWIGKLLEEGYIKKPKSDKGSPFKWVHNPVSFEMYFGDDLNENDKDDKTLIRALGTDDSIKSIADEKYDLIFLARSDTWSPPHLDKYFCLLTDLMQEHFNEVQVESGITNPRKAYLQYAVTMREAQDKMMKGREICE